MRAAVISENFLSKCNSARSYSSNKSPKDHATEPTIVNKTLQPIKENRYVQKLLNIFKLWKQPAQRQSPETDESCPRITKIENKSIKSSKPSSDVQNASASDQLTETPNGLIRNRHSMPAVKVNQETSTVGSESNQLKPIRNVPKNLLQYPVLPLDETIKRYLLSVQPFFKKVEFVIEQEEAKKFLNSDGRELQRLLEMAGNKQFNWLTDRWTNAMYLRRRAPLTVFSSPCIAFPRQEFCTPLEYVDFTAKAIYGMCEFKQMVENDEIPVHSMETHSLDNSQFHNVYGTVRIPQPACDLLQQCSSNYVIIIHKNNFFKLPVLKEDGEPISVPILRNQLLQIIGDEQPKGLEIGLLTHDTRDNWTVAHEKLCAKDANATTVQCIEQSLFTVSMDEEVEVADGEERNVLAAQLLHGGGINMNSANRWMDKTLQLIVNPNGMAGICCEHSPADPQPAAMIMDFVQRNLDNPDFGLSYLPNLICDCKFFEQLEFSEENDAIDLWLGAAKRSIEKISGNFKLNVFKFPCYGKCLIKSQGLVPDSYIQMAIQLAYYRLHQMLPAQYESAHLRIFKCGRTEGIRSTSQESRAFVHAMVSEMATPKARLLALRAAVDYHLELTKAAMKGRGVDRHLFGLKQIACENAKPLPDFFYSEGYVKSTNYQIITSQVSTPHDSFMAYGPRTSEGYGCCYNPREKDIIFAVSSWNLKPHINATDYGRAIELAMADMGSLILETGGPDVAKDAAACMQKT